MKAYAAFILTPVGTFRPCPHADRYTPDQPVANTDGSLAPAEREGPGRGESFVWLVDDSVQGPLYSRCQSMLPPELGDGELAGINARWRLYRYGQDAVYRPHVDGAWPGSGLGSDGKLEYDAFGDRWSRLTFLLYLWVPRPSNMGSFHGTPACANDLFKLRDGARRITTVASPTRLCSAN